MIDQIRNTLSEATKLFSDTRLNHCDLQVDRLSDGQLTLSGTVLDSATLSTVADRLRSRHDTLDLNIEAVQVLRQPEPEYLTVGTNLAGYHRKPSRQSERVSEVVDGQIVELLLERDNWAFLRQADGYLGWVYRPYLIDSPPPAPTHIVIEPVSLMRSAERQTAALSGRLLAGTTLKVAEESGGSVRVDLAGGRSGWLPVADLRPLDSLPHDEPSIRRQIVEDSRRHVGVRYLWGGGTAQGIDCSGLAQLLYHQVGIEIPRDADMQFDAGRQVEAPFQPGDLLFFGSSKDRRIITHVGISLGDWRIIHSSGPRNGVYEDDVSEVDWLRDAYVGARTFVPDSGT